MTPTIPSGDFNEGHTLRAQVAAVGYRGLDQGSVKRESGRLIDSSSLDDLESSSVSSSVDSSTGDPLGDPDHLSAFFSHAQLHSTRNIYQEDSHPSPPSKASPNPFGLVPPTPSNQNQVQSSHYSPIRSDSTSMANHPSQAARIQLEMPPDTKAMQTIQYAQQAIQATAIQAVQYSHPTTTSSPPVPQNRSREQSRPSRTPQPMSPLPSLPPSAPPMTNRSRIESEQSLATGSGKTPTTTRPRRVSDGSTAANGALRKDMLLQRMAEALQIERAKSLVFQKELQNAEHEIDELASSLDELKRLHHKALYTLKREVSALKKERESLLEALEIAEGVEQHEAERYMALIDPTQAVLMDQTQEPEIEEQVQEDDRPVELIDIGGGGETVRAQAQKRSAIRARRINDEISKLGPPGQADLDLGSSHSPRHSGGIDRERERDDRRRERGDRGERDDRREREKELDSERDGRDIRRIPVTTHRPRRLSKSRPSSRDGGGGGAFWRRSGSRNRDGEPVESSRTLGHNPSSSEFYDSGSLQNRGSTAAGVGKIGKLFRKVFPIHGNNDQDWNGVDIDPHEEEAIVDQFHHRVPVTRERAGRSSNININGGGGANRMAGRMRSSSRTRA